MSRFGNTDRNRTVAVWLFAMAAMVFLMVVVGGITRLTGSGLSITEWKPIMGAIPPLNEADWNLAFAKYREIPQYTEVNAGMTLGEFKFIFFWEWFHRLLGRLIGLVFFVPMVFFLMCRAAPQVSAFYRLAMPKRLIWRCVLLLVLGGLQGLIGWWMVSSGLSERVSVAPERLATHLGLALILFSALIWTGLEAWTGHEHSRPPVKWVFAASMLLGLVFFQCLLGGLVAGGKAGLVYTDWPLMNGQVLPPADWSLGVIGFLHDTALTQFNHRIIAYVLLIVATLYAIQAWRWRAAEGVGGSAYAVAITIWMQAILGIFTLIYAVPLWLGVLHQAGAAVVLAVATINLWVVLRSHPRLFMSAPRMMGR